MLTNDDMNDFIDYAIYYPDEDEEGFDGVHYGGVKGIREDAPQSAKTAYKRYLEAQAKAERAGAKT